MGNSDARQKFAVLLGQEPSLELWEKLVEEAERLTDEQFLELLPWLNGRLSGWSDYLRPARVSWVEAILSGKSVAHLRMARLVSIFGEYQGAYFIFEWRTAFLPTFRHYTQSPDVRSVTVLSLADVSIGDEGIETLVTASNTAAVRDLRVEQCRLTDDGIALLAASEWARHLRLLSIAREQNVTRRCVDIIANSPNLGSLEELYLDGVDDATRDRLVASPNLPSLRIFKDTRHCPE